MFVGENSQNEIIDGYKKKKVKQLNNSTYQDKKIKVLVWLTLMDFIGFGTEATKGHSEHFELNTGNYTWLWFSCLNKVEGLYEVIWRWVRVNHYSYDFYKLSVSDLLYSPSLVLFSPM